MPMHIPMPKLSPRLRANLPSYIFAVGGSTACAFGIYEALTPGYAPWGIAMQFGFTLLFALAVFIDQMEALRQAVRPIEPTPEKDTPLEQEPTPGP